MLRNLRRIANTIPPRTRFASMLSQYGAFETWRRICRGGTSGFTDLYEAGLLGLSLEALVVDNPKYHALFSGRDLLVMRHALETHGYKVTSMPEFAAERMAQPA